MKTTETMSASSSSSHRSSKPERAPTDGHLFATWSSKGTPSDNDEVKDAYKSYQKLRNNYAHIGDAYDRRLDTASEWEINDP
jgi:hypothetical protein